MTDLHKLSATQQLELVASGDLSCLELVEAHLVRIQELNAHLNAITTVLSDSARAAARAADNTTLKGPLHGLPFSVKGDIDCIGSATSRGVRALADALPYADAPVVARLKAAGAIPMARTNLSEWVCVCAPTIRCTAER